MHGTNAEGIHCIIRYREHWSCPGCGEGIFRQDMPQHVPIGICSGCQGQMHGMYHMSSGNCEIILMFQWKLIPIMANRTFHEIIRFQFCMLHVNLRIRFCGMLSQYTQIISTRFHLGRFYLRTLHPISRSSRNSIRVFLFHFYWLLEIDWMWSVQNPGPGIRWQELGGLLQYRPCNKPRLYCHQKFCAFCAIS